ncbi:MAG: hypothetical protein IJC94_06095 [Oscillospiraceae bacterium]|nr:hypothetical protein [Oscillospiraceae bacterium]
MELKRFKGIGITSAAVMVAWLLLSDAKVFAEGIYEGIKLCTSVLIPSLFPFMALAGFICTSGVSEVLSKVLKPLTVTLFKLPEELGSIIIMGFIGGYPAAARSIAAEVKQGRISAETGERMLCFCVNAGPPFLIGVIGVGMLGSFKAGAILFVSQLVSALVIGFLMSLRAKREQINRDMQGVKQSYSQVFVNSVTDAAQAVISMCAFVLLFCAALNYCKNSGFIIGGINFAANVFSLNPNKVAAFLIGITEVTAGCAAVAENAGMPMLAFVTAFGSLSVIFQIYGQLAGSGMRLTAFTLSRVIHGLLSMGICALLIKIFPDAVTAAVQFKGGEITSGSAVSSVLLVAVAAMFLLTIGKRQS